MGNRSAQAITCCPSVSVGKFVPQVNYFGTLRRSGSASYAAVDLMPAGNYTAMFGEKDGTNGWKFYGIATLETGDSTAVDNSGGLLIYRYGRLRSINFNGNGVGLPTVGAIIPSADRPPRIVRVPASTQTDSNGYWVSIGTDGKLTLYKAGNAITSGSYTVFFSATYLVN